MLVRNAATYLQRNVDLVLSQLAESCIDWRLFYVENDSSDRTREILDTLSKRDGRVQGEQLHCVQGAEPSSWTSSVPHAHTRRWGGGSLGLCGGTGLMNCNARTLFIGMLRERLLRRALAWQAAELLVMIDIDFVCFVPQAFWNMYTQVLVPRNASGVFGMSRDPVSHQPWDKGAVVPMSALDDIVQDAARVVPVRSAFSGFGLYSVRAIRVFHASYNFNPAVMGILVASGENTTLRKAYGVMEHIHFNVHLPRLYVYTAFQPGYEFLPPT